MSADTTQVEQTQGQPQQASAVSTWLKRGFVAVVLVAIPLLYWFGYIGVVWLNRIGIILNFCAGFMVAPELLRVERLRWIEEGIEKVLARFQKFANANRVLSPIKKLYLVGYIVVFISFTVITLAKRNGDDTLPNYLTVPAPFVIVISVCVVGVIVATLLVALLLDYVAGKLAGDDRLRSILVWWGIVFFIVGNLLQFISTF